MFKFDDEKETRKTVGFFVVLTALVNIVFWGGLIFAALWALRHFGVI